MSTEGGGNFRNHLWPRRGRQWRPRFFHFLCSCSIRTGRWTGWLNKMPQSKWWCSLLTKWHGLTWIPNGQVWLGVAFCKSVLCQMVEILLSWVLEGGTDWTLLHYYTTCTYVHSEKRKGERGADADRIPYLDRFWMGVFHDCADKSLLRLSYKMRQQGLFRVARWTMITCAENKRTTLFSSLIDKKKSGPKKWAFVLPNAQIKRRESETSQVHWKINGFPKRQLRHKELTKEFSPIHAQFLPKIRLQVHQGQICPGPKSETERERWDTFFIAQMSSLICRTADL